MATRKRKKADDEHVETLTEGESGLSTTSGKGNLQKGPCRVFSMVSALRPVLKSFCEIFCSRVVFGVPVYFSLCCDYLKLAGFQKMGLNLAGFAKMGLMVAAGLGESDSEELQVANGTRSRRLWQSPPHASLQQ
jgi:hypothetical protein